MGYICNYAQACSVILDSVNNRPHPNLFNRCSTCAKQNAFTSLYESRDLSGSDRMTGIPIAPTLSALISVAWGSLILYCLVGKPPRTRQSSSVNVLLHNSHRQKVLRIDFGDFSIILQPTEVSSFHNCFHLKSFLNSIDYYRNHPSPIRTNLIAKH